MTVHIHRLGTGKPVVFFHGWGFDSQIWQPLMPALLASKRYQLFMVDLPGFGQTELMAWDHFCSQLLPQLPSTFALIGWSLGGLCASRLTLMAPLRVTHLINIASSPYFMRTQDWPGVDACVLAQFHAQLLKDTPGTLHQFLLTQLGTLPTVMKSSTPTGLQQGLSWLKQWDLRSEIAQLPSNTAYIFGRLDTITPYQLLPTMQQLYPQFHYHLFRKAAHLPFLSDQTGFLSLLDELLGY